MPEPIPAPKVFISYSWTSEDYVDRVIRLAERLVSDGIDVVLDQWDLKEGNDTIYYMEQVRSTEVNKVLVLCDRGYKEKAEKRAGGVGTEAQIISPEVYRDVTQEKFIPIVTERDDEGNACVPTFMDAKFYIDLSNADTYEDNYDRLLRNLYGRPSRVKPPMGGPPKHLFEASPVTFKTSVILQQIKSAYEKDRGVDGFRQRFFDEYILALEEYQIALDSTNKTAFDETVLKSIHDCLPLRDDFISLVETDCFYSDSIDVDSYTRFFEEMHRFTYYRGSGGSFSYIDFDNYKFLLRELFVYLTAILLRNRRFQTLGELFSATYFLSDTGKEAIAATFDYFDSHLASLDELRNTRLELRRFSVTAEVLVSRTTARYKKNDITTADLIIFYNSILSRPESFSRWFPRTYVYRDHGKVEFLNRLQSKKFFEQFKPVLGVDSIESFQRKITEIPTDLYRGYSGSFNSIPRIDREVSPETIGSLA